MMFRRRPRAGGLVPRRRGWPSSLRVIRQTVNDPDPTAAGMVATMDAYDGRNLNGHTGTIIIGEPSSMHSKFTGYLHPTDHGRPAFGAVTSLLRQPQTLLPKTSGPVIGSGRSVADIIADQVPGERP